MPPTVVLLGTFDTKAAEYAFVRDRLAAAGVRTLLVDAGVLGTPALHASTGCGRSGTAAS